MASWYLTLWSERVRPLNSNVFQAQLEFEQWMSSFF